MLETAINTCHCNQQNILFFSEKIWNTSWIPQVNSVVCQHMLEVASEGDFEVVLKILHILAHNNILIFFVSCKVFEKLLSSKYFCFKPRPTVSLCYIVCIYSTVWNENGSLYCITVLKNQLETILFIGCHPIYRMVTDEPLGDYLATLATTRTASEV